MTANKYKAGKHCSFSPINISGDQNKLGGAEGTLSTSGRRDMHTCFGKVKPETMRALRRPRRTWGDDIEKDFKEVGYEGLGWTNMALNRTCG